MASFLDPPKNYAPPTDWVDPTAPDEEDEEKESPTPEVNIPLPTPHDDDCQSCRDKLFQARFIGIAVGAVIGALCVGAVAYAMTRSTDEQ